MNTGEAFPLHVHVSRQQELRSTRHALLGKMYGPKWLETLQRENEPMRLKKLMKIVQLPLGLFAPRTCCPRKARLVRLQFHTIHLLSAAGARIKSIALTRQLSSLPAFLCLARFSPLDGGCSVICSAANYITAAVMVIRRLTAA